MGRYAQPSHHITISLAVVNVFKTQIPMVLQVGPNLLKTTELAPGSNFRCFWAQTILIAPFSPIPRQALLQGDSTLRLPKSFVFVQLQETATKGTQTNRS